MRQVVCDGCGHVIEDEAKGLVTAKLTIPFGGTTRGTYEIEVHFHSRHSCQALYFIQAAQKAARLDDRDVTDRSRAQRYQAAAAAVRAMDRRL